MLFSKECKKVVLSLAFLLYIIVVFAMYYTQFTVELKAPCKPPEKGEDFYGWKIEEVPEVLMPAATEMLVAEYLSGSFGAYPFMLYKEVKLKETGKAQMAEIIEELTGLTRQELDGFAGYEEENYEYEMDENGNPVMAYREAVMPEFQLRSNISYERFRELMAQADDIIGGGSKYSEEYIVGNFGQIPMSYEDALEEYEEMVQDGNIAKAYGRLFCDYLGIVLGIIPIFVCVGLWQMDKKAQMEQLIYDRKISSVKLIGARYLALMLCMTIPVAMVFIHAMAGVDRLYPDENINFAAAAGLCALWLIPGLMIVTGLGALISELFSPLLAIFVHGVWWYISLEMTPLTGGTTKWGLIIRHNSLNGNALFMSQYGNFVWNRIMYIFLSLIALGLAMLVYERKRVGGMNMISISKFYPAPLRKEGV